MALTLNLLAGHVKNSGSLLSDTELATNISVFDNQINSNMQDKITGAVSEILNTNITPFKPLVTNSAGKIIEYPDISSTELGYLHGSNSDIQSQINSKETNISSESAISNLINTNLPDGTVLVSDENGKLVSSNITVDEINKIDNVNDSIQTQLDNILTKANKLNTITINPVSKKINIWTTPTITSIETLSNLPTLFLLVKDKITTQKFIINISNDFHTSVVNNLIDSIEITVDSVTTSLNLTSSNIIIDTSGKTISFSYTATSLSSHFISLKLMKPNITGLNQEYDTLIFTIPTSKIFNFPTLDSNTKNISSGITLNETLTVTSVFNETLNTNFNSSINILDTITTRSLDSSSISTNDKNLIYSFEIQNDTDHSGEITLTFGDINQNYNWYATGFLTAASHIYTFANNVSYDGSSNGVGNGFDITQNISSELLLTFSGGDGLHGITFNAQIHSITYTTVNTGTTKNVTESQITYIDPVMNKILLNNIIVETRENVNFQIYLKGPDSTVQSTALEFIIPDSKIKRDFIDISWNANHVSSGWSFANASSKEITNTLNPNDTIKINTPAPYGHGYSALPGQFLEGDFEIVIANYGMGYQYAMLYITNDSNATISDFDSQYPNISDYSSITAPHQMKPGGSFQADFLVQYNTDITGFSGATYRALAGYTNNGSAAWGGRIYFQGTQHPFRNIFVKYKREGTNFSAVWSQNGPTGPWITDRFGIPQFGFDINYSNIHQIPNGYNKLLIGFANTQNATAQAAAWPKYNIILDYGKMNALKLAKENALNIIGASSTIETINAKYFRMRIINPIDNNHCSWFHRIGFYSNYNNAKTDIGNFTSDPNQSWNWNGQDDPFSENQDLIRWRYKTNTSNIQLVAHIYPSRTTDQVLRNAPYTLNLTGSNPSPTWVNNNGFHRLSSFPEYLLTVEFELVGGNYQDIQVIKFGNMRRYGYSKTQIEFYTSPDNSTWTQVYCYYYPDPTNTSTKLYTHQGPIEHNIDQVATYPTPANLKMANLLNPASGSITMPQTNDPVYGFLTTTAP
tara:strand:+ start:6009 stop:9113 length:3105 start_codon:yes stop_codon:yes gene_type:complete